MQPKVKQIRKSGAQKTHYKKKSKREDWGIFLKNDREKTMIS